MKNVLFSLGLICLLLTGCNSKEVWDVDYDLTNEIGRQLHCYAQFQKNVKADVYGAEWVSEVSNGFETIVEGKVKANDEEYNLVCNYSDDGGEFSVNYTPVDMPEIGNPASEYCINNGGSYKIISSETDIYGECTLPDGTKCEEWELYNGECGVGGNEDEVLKPQFDLENEEGRIAACEERAGFYLNFNEGTFTWENEEDAGASFVRNGHVVYLKRGENAEDDVECIIDMVDKSVTVDFTNHNYLGAAEE